MSNQSWKSELTAEMLSVLTDEQRAELIDCLNEAIQAISIDFGVGQ
jgi:hypothetical protein